MSSNSQPFSCGKCGKTFTLATNLQRHVKAHSMDRPFPCDQCKLAFTRADALRIHVRQHEAENSNARPFKCDQCDLRFTRQSSLNDHQDVGSDYCGPCKTLKKPFGAPVSKGEASAQREIQSKPGKGKPIKRVTPTPLLKAKPPPPMGTDVKKRSSAHQPTSQVHTKSGTSKAAPAHHIMLSQNAKKQQSPVPHGETGNEQSGNAGSSNFNKFTSNIQPRSMPGPANPVNEQALTMFPPSRIVYNGGYGNSTGGVRNAPTLPVNLPTRALNNSPGPAQSAPLTAAELQFQLDLDEWERNHPL